MATQRRRPNRKKPTHVKEAIRGLVPSVHHGELDVEYNAYLKEIDPSGESKSSNDIRRALAISTDVRFKEFLGRLSDPKYKGKSLATIAKSCDIQLPEFAQWWQSAQKMRLLARAQEGLAEITEHIIKDARSKMVVCEVCDGYGWRYADAAIPAQYTPGGLQTMGDRQIRTCLSCAGTGLVEVSGQTEARRMLMDMNGLNRKGGGPSVTINTNFGGVGLESAVEKMNQVNFTVEADYEEMDK